MFRHTGISTSEVAVSLLEPSFRSLNYRPPLSSSYGFANLTGDSHPDAGTPLSTISEDSREALQSSSGEEQGLLAHGQTDFTVQKTDKTPEEEAVAELGRVYKTPLTRTYLQHQGDISAACNLSYDDATATASEGSNSIWSQRDWSSTDMSLSGTSFLQHQESGDLITVYANGNGRDSRSSVGLDSNRVNREFAVRKPSGGLDDRCQADVSSVEEGQRKRSTAARSHQLDNVFSSNQCDNNAHRGAIATSRNSSVVVSDIGASKSKPYTWEQTVCKAKNWRSSDLLHQFVDCNPKELRAALEADLCLGGPDKEGVMHNASRNLQPAGTVGRSWKQEKDDGIPVEKNPEPEGGKKGVNNVEKLKNPPSLCEGSRRASRSSAGSSGSSTNTGSSAEEATISIKRPLDVATNSVQPPVANWKVVLEEKLLSKPRIFGKYGPAQRVLVVKEEEEPKPPVTISPPSPEPEQPPTPSPGSVLNFSLPKVLPSDEELLQRLEEDPQSINKSLVGRQEGSISAGHGEDGRKTDKLLSSVAGPSSESTPQQESHRPVQWNQGSVEATPRVTASQSKHAELASSDLGACQGNSTAGGEASREQNRSATRVGQLPPLGGKLPPLGGSGRLMMFGTGGSQISSLGATPTTSTSGARLSPPTPPTPNMTPCAHESNQQAVVSAPYTAVTPSVDQSSPYVPAVPPSAKMSPVYPTPRQNGKESLAPLPSSEKQLQRAFPKVEASPSGLPQSVVRDQAPSPAVNGRPQEEGLPVPSPAAVGSAPNVFTSTMTSVGSGPKARTKIEDEIHIWVNGRAYEKIQVVGKGGSSKVYKVLGPDRNIYALKRIRVRETDEGNRFAEEITLLNRLRGKNNIIQLIDSQIVLKGQVIFVVLEYGEIDLNTKLHKMREERKASGQEDQLDENFIRLNWQNMLKAVQTIHQERIVHSDLKPANFLFVQSNLKLIDFGIAKTISNDTTNLHSATQAGTLNYMSPEALMSSDPSRENEVKVGRPSDIWSLGCILYQMVYGQTPFGHIVNTWRKTCAITDGTHGIDFPPISNPWLLDTMKRCLERDPQRRIGIPELLQHTFLHPDKAKPSVVAAPSQLASGLNPTQLESILVELAAVAAAAPPGSVDVVKITAEIFSQLSLRGSVNLKELFAQFAPNVAPKPPPVAKAPPPPPPPRAPPPPPPRAPPPPPFKAAPKALTLGGKGKPKGPPKANSSASMGGDLANMAAEKARQMAARRAAAAERAENGSEKENDVPHMIDFRSKLKASSRGTGGKSSGDFEDRMREGQGGVRHPLKAMQESANGASDLHDILQRRLAKVRASQVDETTTWD